MTETDIVDVIVIGAGPAGLYVFDEVDTGIGGAVAEAVGRMLREVSQSRQLLCITHLPQIACFADHHMVVRKQVVQGRTVSTVEPLRGELEVQRELARMLAGAEVSQVALDHAAHLLKEGHRDVRSGSVTPITPAAVTSAVGVPAAAQVDELAEARRRKTRSKAAATA